MTMLIVAGITRSGLSLTMQMLYAGGFPCQGTPPAFEPFPLGCIPWEQCAGTAIKLVDAQWQHPADGNYKIVRLRRNMVEQARSANKWGAALLGLPAIPIATLIGSFRRDYKLIDSWCDRHSTFAVDFERLIGEPGRMAAELAVFSGLDLDVARMTSVVIPRSPNCHPELLELRLIREAEPTC